MALPNNYGVFAKIFKNHLLAIRSDDMPEDPHRIYLKNEDQENVAFYLYPMEFNATIEKGVIEDEL